jgi:hypothetical protein
VLPGLPPELKARLLDVFDIRILWNKPGRQATVHAEITDATLQALPAILNPGQDGYDDKNEQVSGDPADVEDLFEAPIANRINRQALFHQDLPAADRLTMHLRTRHHWCHSPPGMTGEPRASREVLPPGPLEISHIGLARSPGRY